MFINALFVGLLLVLLYQLITHHSSTWADNLFAYRKRYLVAVALVIAITAIMVYIMIAGSRSMNRAVAIVFIVASVVSEVGLRSVYAARPFGTSSCVAVPYLMFVGKPGTHTDRALSEKMGGPGVQDTFVLNRLGFRGPIPTISKRDEHRVLVLGGSTVFNGAPLSQSIAGWMERGFQESGQKSARVYNWGVVSAVSGQELATVVYRVLDYDPDLLVVYDGANDLLGPYYYDPRPGYPYDFMFVEAGHRYAERRAAVVDLLAAMFRRSRLLDFVFCHAFSARSANVQHLREVAEYGTRAWEQRIVDAYADHVERMAVVARSRGIRVAVFLQPLLPFKPNRVGGERKLPSRTAFTACVNRVYPKMAAAAAERLTALADDGVLFVDLSRMFAESEEDLFWDEVHVTNRGNELVARRILSEFQKASW